MPALPESFVCRKTFEATINGCLNKYVQDQVYHCHAGAPWDELRREAKKWVKAGKIRMIPYAGQGGPSLSIGMGGKPADKPRS